MLKPDHLLVHFLLTIFLFILQPGYETKSIGFAQTNGSNFELSLQSRKPVAENSANFHTVLTQQSWAASKTAVIVCDMWDAHHCYNAVVRVGQLAPRMEQVISHARSEGATIIHAPSSCVDFYKSHPARTRMVAVPKSESLPEKIGDWCDKIPSEEAGKYPIDQSDGGEDDDPVQHEKWAKELTAKGLNPKAPWKRQTEMLTVDSEKDFISDSGAEIWSLLEHKNIDNVILLGVHTNMCVLGRPFGLRQMAKNGKNVVLLRDMTDSMYNPKSSPFVSHFSGTDLIVEHIEKFVCPTITSDQLIGGKPFRFPADKRPHVAIVVAEDEYETERTLPQFVSEHLRKDYRVSMIFGSKNERNDIPGVDAIADADLLFLSIRRRTLPAKQLELFREFEASGKPMLGIRTSSHAFCLRNKPAPEGLTDWPELDAEVWGGNYHGHSKNDIIYEYDAKPETKAHAVMNGLDLCRNSLKGNFSMYFNEPLKPSAQPLLWGTLTDGETILRHPVAWTNKRANGGLSFYTSLGHKQDFEERDFNTLLMNSIEFLIKQPVSQ